MAHDHEPDQIARWFADRVQLDLRPGSDGTLTFEDQATAEAVTAALVVESVDPPHGFSFRWGHPDGEAPVPGNSVLVEFTISTEDDERLGGLPRPPRGAVRHAGGMRPA